MASIETKKINTELLEHQNSCLKMIELTYVKKSPMLSIAILLFIAGLLAYYYKTEAKQDERDSITEMHIMQLNTEFTQYNKVVIRGQEEMKQNQDNIMRKLDERRIDK